MEISMQKTLSSDRLPEYWHFLAPSLINYIGEILNLPDDVGIEEIENSKLKIEIYPNPANDQVTVTGLPEGSLIELFDTYGRLLSAFRIQNSEFKIDVSLLTSGLYLLRTPKDTAKILKY